MKGFEPWQFAISLAGLALTMFALSGGILFTVTTMDARQGERLARVESAMDAANYRMTALESATGTQLREIRDALTRLDGKLDRTIERVMGPMPAATLPR